MKLSICGIVSGLLFSGLTVATELSSTVRSVTETETIHARKLEDGNLVGPEVTFVLRKDTTQYADGTSQSETSIPGKRLPGGVIANDLGGPIIPPPAPPSGCDSTCSPGATTSQTACVGGHKVVFINYSWTNSAGQVFTKTVAYDGGTIGCTQVPQQN